MQRFKDWRKRAKRVRQLQAEIDRASAAAFERLRQGGDPEDIFNSTESANAELNGLRQRRILGRLSKSGLNVPNDYWVHKGRPGPYVRLLTPEGEQWAHGEMKRLRREEIEFWAKIVLPILSLIISILARLRSTEKRRLYSLVAFTSTVSAVT